MDNGNWEIYITDEKNEINDHFFPIICAENTISKSNLKKDLE
jgi:hypothetical protein